MKLKFVSLLALVLSLSFIIAPLASAHVSVSPTTAVAGERVTFSVSVPNEKQVAVTGLKLTLPAGLDDVSPTVHPGWTIQTTTADDKVTVITWSDGQIPVGQRDDFTFRAQVPAKTKELVWKAYQTYADGSTVAWDQTPTDSEEESETTGPYSVTTISADATDETDTDNGVSTTLVLGISLAALVLSVIGLVRKRS